MKIKNIQKLKRQTRKRIALLLAICLLVGIFSSIWKNVLTIQAATDDYMICLGVGEINNPKSEELSKDTQWSGDYVWFGNYGGKAIKWRILDKSGKEETGTSSVNGGMLIQSDTILKQQIFGTGSDWGTSDVRTWLQGNNEFLNDFTSAEISVIMESTKGKGSDLDNFYSIGLSDDTVFLLDLTDINNSKYGYIINDADGYRMTNSFVSTSVWWLRSNLMNFVSVVINNNEFVQFASFQEAGIVPALNIKLDSILFSSVPGTDFSSLLSTKGNNNNREWKLTLLDNNQSVSVDTSDGKEMTRSDKGGKTTITVPYTYVEIANAKSANQLSVMITDKDYTADNTAVIKTYGKVSGDDGLQENGEISFVLPEDYDADADKVYLLSEQVNGDNMTNYASFPVLMEIPTSYTINYDSNGGSGQMQSEKAGVGEAFTLPDCGFTPPEGKQFKEWAIGSIDGTTVSAGGNYTFLENTTVYAVWEDITYTIEYDANGGSGQMQSEVVVAGTEFTLPDCGFTPPEGKQFKEWAIGSVDGTTVSAGGNYTFLENTTVYAVWEDITYTIEYDANGGSGEMQSEVVVAGTEFTLPDCGFTPPEGKQFKEWAIGSVEGTVLNAGEKHTFTEDTTVYAIWEIIEEDTTAEEETTTEEEETTTEEDTTAAEEETTTEEDTTEEEETTTEEDTTAAEEETTTEEDTTTEEITTEEDTTAGEEITTEEDTTTERSTFEKDTAVEKNTAEADTTTASNQGAAVNTGDVIPMAVLGILLASAVVVIALCKMKVNN